MSARVVTLIAVATALVGAFLAPPTAGAQERCASAEACLAKSFASHWTQYQDLIEKAWDDKKRVAELLRKATALGRADLVARLTEEQAKIEARWRFADAVAQALTAPHFRTFLERHRDEAARKHAAARARAQRETELYRRLVQSNIGPQRDSVIRDIASYEREAKELRKTFYRDGLLASASALKESADVVAHGWKEIATILSKSGLVEGSGIAGSVPYVEAVSALMSSGYAGFEAVHTGVGVADATARNRNFAALIEATRGASAATLRVAELLAASPASPAKQAAMREWIGVVGSRTVVWANVLALGLDTALTVNATRLLREAETRQVQVETSDAQWRARVEATARIARDAALRQERAQRQLDQQRDIAALYERIRAEGGR